MVKVSSNGSGTLTIYCDWNDDGDYDDANESVGSIVDSSDVKTGTYVGLSWLNDGTENYIDDLEADAN
jgi:hypothetical protein